MARLGSQEVQEQGLTDPASQEGSWSGTNRTMASGLSVPADGTPTNTREGGSGEDRSRLRDPHIPAAGRRGTHHSIPNPRQGCCYPKPSPHTDQSQGGSERTRAPPHASPLLGATWAHPDPYQRTYLGDCPCIHALRQRQPCIQEGVTGEVRGCPCPCAVRRGQPVGGVGSNSPMQLRGCPRHRDVGG